MSEKSEFSFESLLGRLNAYHPDPDVDLVSAAYDFARRQHEGQLRHSGEPFFHHVVATAHLVCRLRLDVPSVCAALLHDTLEDCPVPKDELTERFSEEIAEIVDGVTKLTRVEFSSKEEKQAESFRKMLLAMAKDIRVVLVKLCDRLHNMRTLRYMEEGKRRLKAQETLDIYAPLANRLGIHWLKSELEDLCLMNLRPEIFTLIKESFTKTKGEREDYISATITEIVSELEQAGISGEVAGRSKHFYSIWRKMEAQRLSFDEVYDLEGFRILVPTVRACYETLGVIHAAWKPVPGRFKDYIAMPKPNMYQSLHSTVIGPRGMRIEIQIRTPEMHRIAEEGIAAHWRYKESGGKSRIAGPAQKGFDLQWVKELVDTQQYVKNPDEFIQSVKGELFPNDVFVFTPKGDLIRLAQGSTPVDLAYAIHTDIGHCITGARVNGTIVPINYKLENGDTVEILTQKSQTPSKDWLEFVRSSKAKQRIRAYLKTEEQSRSASIGFEVLAKDLRKVKKSLKKLEKEKQILPVANDFGYANERELYAAIGYGKVHPAKVLAKLLPEESDPAAAVDPTPIERIFQRAAKASREKVGVKVSGFDDILVRFARCCEPLPGDRVVGYITRGRGVTIHRADCPQVYRSDPMRKIEVEWDTGSSSSHRVRLDVHSEDTIGLLANVTMAITNNGANINSAHVKTMGTGKAVNSFEVTIKDASQLDSLRRAIERVPGVIRVDRKKHSRSKKGD